MAVSLNAATTAVHHGFARGAIADPNREMLRDAAAVHSVRQMLRRMLNDLDRDPFDARRVQRLRLFLGAPMDRAIAARNRIHASFQADPADTGAAAPAAAPLQARFATVACGARPVPLAAASSARHQRHLSPDPERLVDPGDPAVLKSLRRPAEAPAPTRAPREAPRSPRRLPSVPSRPGRTAAQPRQPEQADALAPSHAMAWSNGGRLATRATTVALWAALAAGPVALALGAVAGGAAPAPLVTHAAAADASTVAAVGEFAESYVLAWGRATVDDSSALNSYITTGSTLSLPKTAPVLTDPAVAAIRATATTPPAGPTSTTSTTWSVVVAVTAQAGASSGTPAVSGDAPVGGLLATPTSVSSRRYYQVSITALGHGAALTMTPQLLPAPVPAPVIGEAPQLAYAADIALTGPLATSVQGFLNALLTGQGDLSRYLSPSLALDAIIPAPYAQVRLTDVRADKDTSSPKPSDGTVLHLLVTADMSRKDPAATNATAVPGEVASFVSAQYPLTVTARAGRWEISGLDPAPQVQAGPQAAAPTP